jgi:hypothetical protein
MARQKLRRFAWCVLPPSILILVFACRSERPAPDASEAGNGAEDSPKAGADQPEVIPPFAACCYEGYGVSSWLTAEEIREITAVFNEVIRSQRPVQVPWDNRWWDHNLGDMGFDFYVKNKTQQVRKADLEVEVAHRGRVLRVRRKEYYRLNDMTMEAILAIARRAHKRSEQENKD